jgi:hypothetical protein
LWPPVTHLDGHALRGRIELILLIAVIFVMVVKPDL